MDQADVVLVAPSEELYAYPPPVRRNAARRKRAFELPTIASADYEQLLVRTALIRSDKYREGKFLPALRSMNDVARLLAHLANANQEHFVTIPVNNALHPLAVHETGIGPAGYAAVSAAEVLRIVLLTSATGFVIAHNHPSGSPEPSKDDFATTKAIQEAAKCIGLSLFDSMIVGYDGFASITSRERGFWSDL